MSVSVPWTWRAVSYYELPEPYVPDRGVHGSGGSYKRGCRCELCEAAGVRVRELKRTRQQRYAETHREALAEYHRRWQQERRRGRGR